MSRKKLRNRFFVSMTAFLCLLLPSGLKAQEADYVTHIVKWYEDMEAIAGKYGISSEIIMVFNGLEEPKVERRQVLKIPLYPEKVDLSGRKAPAQTPADEPEMPSTPDGCGEGPAQDTSATADRPGMERHIFAPVPIEAAQSKVNVALALPFHQNGKKNSSNYDFYCGALLAAKSLAENGTDIDINVFDTSEGLDQLPVWQLNECDFVIGPISKADMDSTLRRCGEGQTRFISPLDSRTAVLAGDCPRFIHAPSGADAQNEDVISWLKEDLKVGDKVLLFTEADKAPSSLSDALAGSGVEYSTVTYGILQGRNVTGRISSYLTPNFVNRVLIASDNEAFVNDVIRNLKLLLHEKHSIILYAPSKVRGFETIDAESFHELNMRVSTSYYINYDAPDVRAFLMSYRALFGAEPGPFAFQGYDTVHYFSSAIMKYGLSWMDALEFSRGKGLQSDFLFRRPSGENPGLVNTAVRRLVYQPDYSIILTEGSER